MGAGSRLEISGVAVTAFATLAVATATALSRGGHPDFRVALWSVGAPLAFFCVLTVLLVFDDAISPRPRRADERQREAEDGVTEGAPADLAALPGGERAGPIITDTSPPRHPR